MSDVPTTPAATAEELCPFCNKPTTESDPLLEGTQTDPDGKETKSMRRSHELCSVKALCDALTQRVGFLAQQLEAARTVLAAVASKGGGTFYFTDHDLDLARRRGCKTIIGPVGNGRHKIELERKILSATLDDVVQAGVAAVERANQEKGK